MYHDCAQLTHWTNISLKLQPDISFALSIKLPATT